MDAGEIIKWRQRSDFYRSQIISGITAVDNVIGLLLSVKFTSNREEEKNFHSIFFESSFVTFNNRIRMFTTFLKIYIPNIETDQEFKKIFSYLNDFQEIRNLFAHSMNPKDAELRKHDFNDYPFIRVLTYKNNDVTVNDITKQQTEEHSEKIMNTKKLLDKIYELLSSKVHT